MDTIDGTYQPNAYLDTVAENVPSLYWTLSLHLESGRLGELTPKLFAQLGNDIGPSDEKAIDTAYAEARMRRQRSNQDRLSDFYGTRGRNNLCRQLSNAIEPMFDDVADREHLGVVEDYLLAIRALPNSIDVRDFRPLTLSMNSDIGWQTEGRNYSAALEPISLPIQLRRFWYVHRDLSVSYHLSYAIKGYQHRPEDLFLISMLQKLAAPKEFILGEGPSNRITLSGKSPDLTPFNVIKVADAVTESSTDFWQHIARMFDKDFADLYNGLLSGAVLNLGGRRTAWDNVLRHEPCVAVPGLVMPATRSMFYFADQRLRDLLLPRLPDGSPARRLDAVREGFFDTDLKQMLDLVGKRQTQEGTVALDGEFWTWLTKHGGDVIDPAWRGNDEDGESKSSLALCYLFLAGFNQNVIDFLNQDSSEVLDSLDPIYPARKEDLDEGFYARFANPRSLITYVANMRSLEFGRDYIGTCPYAFLIHVLTIHNEFLARDFERRSDHTVRVVHTKVNRRSWKSALEKFYDFRLGEQRRYLLHHSRNVFRYDTERLVFDELQKIRGLDLKHEKAEQILKAAETTTRDLESRRTAAYERTVGYLLSGIGFLTTAQTFITWSNCAKVSPTTAPKAESCLAVQGLFANFGSWFGWNDIEAVTYWASLGLFVCSLACLFALLAMLFYFTYKRLRR